MIVKSAWVLLAFLGLAVFAQAQAPPEPKGALKTSDVGIDQTGVCWVRGPANELKPAGPFKASALTVTATTQLPAGTWLVISTTGAATLVVSATGTTAAGVAGTAYKVV